MKNCIVVLLVMAFLYASPDRSAAQKRYTPDWESLDTRSIPSWFVNAKFGIFIHWGPYSVPAYAPVGVYAEWYQYWLQNKTVSGNGKFTGDEIYDFHQKVYGPEFSYYDFGPLFTAELFNPEEWASLIKSSGAKYVVTTSKHHDGFCLWPSKEANDRGFLWNSMDVGAHRDLLGDLHHALKDMGLKSGFYYSIYEWFHPWYKTDLDKYVNQHMMPQIKDLVTRYSPDIVWTDGEWEHPAETWRSKEFLTWLYNDSPVAKTVVVNDRWGKGTRQKHGGYYTTEYDVDSEFSHPWEECRGMGFSFGYNRNENIEDYNSPKALILTLVDIVSSGGNLLLDIGPDRWGRIPVIMQERLKQMGAWLDKNGEAIYNTSPMRKTQWSEGNRDYKPDEERYASGEFILKQTLNPGPGNARKEAFYTSGEKGFYLILPCWPENGVFRIKDMAFSPEMPATLLADGQKIKWTQSGNDILVKFPEMNPENYQPTDQYAWVVRFGN